MAMERMESGLISPPWEGRNFPGWKEVRPRQQRQRQHPQEARMVIENIRKNSLAEREGQLSTSLLEPQKMGMVMTRQNPSVQTLAHAQPQRSLDLRNKLGGTSGSGRAQVHHCHLHLPNLLTLSKHVREHLPGDGN